MVSKLDLGELGPFSHLSPAEQITGNTSKHNMWDNSAEEFISWIYIYKKTNNPTNDIIGNPPVFCQ